MNESAASELVTVEQAIALIDSLLVHPRTVRMHLADADGFRLATPVTADRDYPPFDKSQMDGYAIRSADVAGVSAELQVIGEIAAGQWPNQTVGPGQAIAIMTGAPMPSGADGIVPVEDVQKLDNPLRIRVIRTTGDPARFIARRGSDCKNGTQILPKGVRLGPAQIALASSVGANEIEVFAAPRVAVLATGNELVPAGALPGPAQIRNSNSPMLVSLLARLGCAVTDLETVPDEPEAIRQALRAGLAHDALFVTGGMSMGEYDYVPSLLQELGVEIKIAKLKMKPGKPFVLGVFERRAGEGEDTGKKHDAETRGRGDADDQGNMENPHGSRPPSAHLVVSASPRLDVTASSSSPCFVFGLPGNPVSGFVCTLRLASRLITRMAGGIVEERWLTGRLDTPLPSNGSREFYLPAIYSSSNLPGNSGPATVTPLNWNGSADLFTLARANALIVRPENDPAVVVGTMLRVLEI